MIGKRGERGSGISVLAAKHDDDDSQYERCFFCCFFPFIFIRFPLFAKFSTQNHILLFVLNCFFLTIFSRFNIIALSGCSEEYFSLFCCSLNCCIWWILITIHC